MLFVSGRYVSQYTSKTYYSSANLAKSGLICTGVCDLIDISGFKDNTTALRYLQIFDAVTLPANGAIPKYSIVLVGGNTAFSMLNPVLPISSINEFTTGVFWALSNTNNILTITTSGDLWVNALVASGS